MAPHLQSRRASRFARWRATTGANKAFADRTGRARVEFLKRQPPRPAPPMRAYPAKIRASDLPQHNEIRSGYQAEHATMRWFR